MIRTALITHPLFLEHRPGPMHPESPSRLESILTQLDAAPLPGTARVAPLPASEEALAAVHSTELITDLKANAGRHARVDADTVMSPHSWEAAALAAGAAVTAIEQVMESKAKNAFALVRPPGHHAEPQRAMGFCLLNNVAIAAEAARRRGAERVLILDWDVHHGNGTQAAFYDRRDVLFLSSHQFPFYPGTGAPEEIGEGEGRGFTVNCALPGGQGDADYGAVFHDLFLPVAQQFRPDLVLVSAGFDPHQADPIGGMRVSERGFAAMCSAARQLAEGSCDGKLVLLLEGGYDLGALARSVHACVEVLSSQRSEDFPAGVSAQTAVAIGNSRAALGGHWKLS
jgi:acetoin utilization deacetylase AcuC-like enzyme